MHRSLSRGQDQRIRRAEVLYNVPHEKERGHVIVEQGANPKPHEMRTTQPLAGAGYAITLVAKSEVDGVKATDAIIEGAP